MVGDWGSRGQSTVIGSVLIFGILILALSSYQVTVVPQENTNIEYQSYLQTSDDMTKLQNDIRRTAAIGAPISSSIETGTLYPVRTLSVNPPPATGRVGTTSSARIRLSNVSAINDETADYWNGATRSYNYRSVRFTPGYNEFSGSPVITDSILTYRDAETAQIPLSSQTLIQDNRVSLTVLQGDLSESGLDVTVIAEPISTSQRTVAVTANDTTGENITLTIPSGVDATTWEKDILSSQLRANGGNIVKISQAGSDMVRIELAGRTPEGSLITYQLQLNYVEVRAESTPTSLTSGAAYLTTAESTTKRATTSETVALGAEVRDAFDNPNSSTEIEFSVTPTGSGRLVGDNDNNGVVTDASDNDGSVGVEYSPSTVDDVTVTASADLDGNGTVEADETVEFTVIVSPSGSGGSTGVSGTVGVTNGGTSVWDPTNDTQTLAAPNGRWENISETGSINVSQAEYGFNFDDGPYRQFDLRFSLENKTTTYFVEILVDDGGAQRVRLTNNNTQSSSTQTLDSNAVMELTGDDSVAVNILDSQNASIYSSSDSTFEQLASEIRQMTNSGDTVILRTGLGRARASVRFDEAVPRYQTGEGGSGDGDGGSGDTVKDVDSEARTSGGSGQVTFVLNNTGDADAVATAIVVNNTTATDAAQVSNGDILTADGTQIVSENIMIGNTQPYDFDSNVTIGSGSEVTFNFNKFRTSGGPGNPNVNMGGETVNITVYFADGTNQIFTINVPN